MLANDVARFPATSRFFGRANVDANAQNGTKSVTVNNLSHSRSIHQNSINSSAAYLPYTAHGKAKVGPSLDLFHLPKRIQLQETADDHEIPVFDYNESTMTDPVLFAESVAEAGKQYGAVKLRMSPAAAAALRANFQINPDTFTFKAHRMLSNALENELYTRLRFYSELIKFHTSVKAEEVPKPEVKEEAKVDELSQMEVDSPAKAPEVAVAETAQENLVPQLEIAEAKEPTSVVKSELQDPLPTSNGESASNSEKTNDSTKAPSPKLPPFLAKLPMMDKRPLDLYDLFRLVVARGGFEEVINRKLWAQVGRELGYKGKITSSLSSSLKMSYAKIIYPLESHLGERLYEISGITNPKQASSISEERFSKRRKANSGAPLVLGSGKEFRRSVKLKASKGFLLNKPHLIDVKTPLIISLKKYQHDFAVANGNTNNATEKADQLNSPISSAAQVNNYLKYLATTMALLQDASRLELSSKKASTFTLRQFIEKDAKFQDWIILTNKSVFQSAFQKPENIQESEGLEVVSVKELERLYWQHLAEDSADDTKIESNASVPSFAHGSGFVRLGDDFSSLRSDMIATSQPTLTENGSSHPNSTGDTGPSTPTNGECISRLPNSLADAEHIFLSQKSGSNNIGSSLNPFNVHNIPFLPNSLLGAYTGPDLNNRDIVDSSFNIGMTFSTENWKCEDHFTQLCSYHFLGDSKRCFFIPELEFLKFEDLLAETIHKANSNQELRRVNLNYDVENWDMETLLNLINAEDETDGITYEYLINSLENMVNPYPELRASHDVEDFQTVTDFKKQKFRNPTLNQEFLITPKMLEERGIKYTTTLHKPGEMIIKFPKTFSSSISFGFNMCEEVNFASKLWLDYAVEGERWLQKQGILPNFLVFKLLVNFAQLFESNSEANVHFDSEVYRKVLNLFSDLIEKELSLRQALRKRIKLKEITVEDRHAMEADVVADDDLLNAYPSRIVINDSSSHQSYTMSLSGFMDYLDALDVQNDSNLEDELPDFVKGSKFLIEHQLFHSDEKLRSYHRLLDGYSVDFEGWTKSYEELMTSEDDIPLKTYKALLYDGQKILSALSGVDKTFRKFCLGSDEDSQDLEAVKKTEQFRLLVQNLQKFVDESTDVIEECQAILTLKHQQRIRNGGNEQTTEQDEDQQTSLHALVELVNKIPNLNFFTPEFDQIFEYRNEIQNFDKACRQLIQKGSTNMSELNDMISLGTSFGIRVPCLDFVIRLRDRLKWVKIFEIIDTGGDPFSGKKDIFSLPDLKSFRDEGYRVLAANDEAMLKAVDNYLIAGQEYDDTVKAYLSSNSSLNDVDLQKLENILIDMEDRSKMTGQERLFVNLESYQGLVDLKGQERLIRFLRNYSENKHSLLDVRQIVLDLQACEYQYNDENVSADLQQSEDWLKELLAALTAVRIAERRRQASPTPKLACNPEVIKKISLIADTCATNFALSEDDPFTESSGYTYVFDLEDNYDEQKPIRYCLCRELEEGTMIECDKCHEWYHVHCVSKISEIGGEDDKYSCPACNVLEVYRASLVYPVFDDKITDTVLQDIAQRGHQLKVVPEVELQSLDELLEGLQSAKEYFAQQQEDTEYNQHGVIYQLFLLRKVIGAPVAVSSMLAHLLNSLKDADLSVTSRTIAQRGDGKEQTNTEAIENGNSAHSQGAGLDFVPKVSELPVLAEVAPENAEPLQEIESIPPPTPIETSTAPEPITHHEPESVPICIPLEHAKAEPEVSQQLESSNTKVEDKMPEDPTEQAIIDPPIASIVKESELPQLKEDVPTEDPTVSVTEILEPTASGATIANPEPVDLDQLEKFENELDQVLGEEVDISVAALDQVNPEPRAGEEATSAPQNKSNEENTNETNTANEANIANEAKDPVDGQTGSDAAVPK